MGRPRKKQPEAEYYEAKEGFQAMLDGELVGIAAGQIVDAGDPILKRREDLFRPWRGPRAYGKAAEAEPEPEPEAKAEEAEAEPEVEQATAGPGEKR